MRKTLLCVVLLVCAVAANAQQTEVNHSEDFQGYGSPANAPGWVDTAIGTSKPEAGGLFKTWPDPTQGNKATNIVYGSKSASGKPEHTNPRIGHFSTLTTKSFNANGRFEYRGRFLRSSADARLGFSFLSSYPEKDSYYLIGLWSVQGSSSLTMQLLSFGAGAPAGTLNSNFTPAIDTWYRFLIQVDDVGGATKIRARFWQDGTTEPATFSIEATDSAATRLTTGRIGLWAAVRGANYFDDLTAKSPVDHTAPVITFSEGGLVLPPNTVTPINHDARVDVRATDDLSGVATVTATADGQPYTPLAPIAAEGPHVIAARAVDNVGNTSTSETTVLVDKTKPVITLTAFGAPLPLPIAKFKAVPSITIAASDQWTGATYTATLDGQPYTSGTPISVEGTHHLVVEAIDGVKNKNIVQATILVDLGATLIEFYEKGVKLTSPAKFKYDPQIEVRLTDTYSTPTYTAVIDDRPWKSLDPVPAGWHKITVNAVDEAGNTSTASLDVLVDKDAPVIVLRESGNVLDPAATARYKRDLGVDVSISDATSKIVSSTTTLNGQPYVSGTLITIEQNTHTIAVHAEDEAGNVTDVTLKILLDKTAPLIAFAESGVKLDIRELQKFRRDASIAIDVTDVISKATYTATLSTPARNTSAPYTSGTPITVEDTHAILVKAVDEAGNTAEATLNVLVDKTVPVIAFSESGTPLDTTKETPFGRDVAVDISVTDNLPGVTYTAKLDGADYATGTPITVDGPHVVSVHAVDAAENTRDGEVKVLVDKTGPAIAFLAAGKELDAKVRAEFNALPKIDIRVTDVHSTATYEAKLGANAFTSGTEVPEGHHTITVRAVDARGNVTETKLDLLVDATAPVVTLKDKASGAPLQPTGGIFARDVTVDAVVSDISDTKTVATLDGKPFSLSVPVSQEGSRTVEVTVTDELNWKTTVASSFIVDKTAPVLAIIETASGAPLLNGASFARNVAFDIKFDDITAVQITATIDDQPYTSGQTYGVDGTHKLVVNAVDAAGNRSATITLTFHIDKNAPEVALLETGVPFPQKKTFTRDVVATITINAATETTTVATIDDQPYTLGTPYAPEGHHHIKVVVTNIAGLKTTIEADFTIDKTKPTLTLYAQQDVPFTDGMKFGADLTPFTVADDNLSRPPKVVVLLDGRELPPGTIVSQEEFHTISATATDDGGLSTSVGPFSFVLDKTPPKVTVKADGEELKDNAQFNKPITPAIEAEDLTAPVYTVTLDGKAYTRGTEIADDAKHVLTVSVKDDLGNERKLDPIHFTIDQTRPVVRILDKETNEAFTGGKFKRAVTAIVQIDDLTETMTTATITDRTTKQESPWTSGQEISSDGHYTLNVTVTDELGWVTTAAPIEFTIDKAAPVIVVTEHDVPLVTETIFNRDAQPKITVTDTTQPTVEAKLNDQPFTSNTLITEERRHTLTVKATDELGFVTEILPIVFTVDKTAPVVVVQENGVVLKDNALLDHDAVPQVLVIDLTAVTIDAKVDGKPFTLGGSVAAEGPHTFDVSVTDAAGWKTTADTIHFTVDKTAPVVTITETENGAPLESGDEFKITITPWVHVTDITATKITAKLNGKEWTPNTAVADEGEYVLEVSVADAVGHITIVPPIAFIIDKSQPVVQLFESSKPFVTGTKLNRPAQLSIDIKDLTKTTTVATIGDKPFTFPGTVSEDGKHTLSVTVTDNLGQAAVVPPVAFIVDQTRPVVTITESGKPLESGDAFQRNVKPEITVTDLTETTVVATLDGQPYKFGTEVTEEGQHTLAAEVTDELGWTTVVPGIVFYIDRTAPVVTLKERDKDLTDGMWFNRDVAPRAVVVDTTATTKTATLSRDGGTAEPYTLETPISAEGKYTLTVTVKDAVGLETKVPPVTFTIDKTPPAITFTYPALNATLNTAKVIVLGESDDAVTVTVNEVETTIDAEKKTYATKTALDLLEGENTLVAFGIDRAGNNTTITQTVQLDTRAPELAITAPLANVCLKTRTLELTGTVGDSHVAGVRISYTPGNAAPIDATLSADRRTWSASINLPSEGKFVLSATASDAGGHQSVATVQVNVDETKPRIEITSAGAAIPQFVNHGVSPSFRILDADAKASLAVTLDGAPYVLGTAIIAEKAYVLKAVATDCAGNKSDEVVAQFVIDKTAPQFASFSPANGASIGELAQVSGVVSNDAISVVAEELGLAATVSNGAFAFNGLPVRDGLNHFTLIATDRAGNTARADYSFRVKTTVPTVEIVENGSPIVNGARYSRQIAVDVRSNEADAKIAATHNGQPFTSGSVIATNGTHTIAATATDSFGHSSSHQVSFTIDLDGPVVTIAEPADGAATTADHIRVRGSISGDPVSATINGAPLALNGNAFDTEVALEFGANDIVVIALDQAGNVGQASVEVTRGGSSTGLILTSPQDKQLTNRRTVTVSGQVLSPAGVTHVTVNGIDIPIDAAGAFLKTDFPLNEGANVITASVTKGATQGSVSVTVTGDFTPPVVTVRESGNVLEDEARFGTRAELTVTATDGGQSITPAILIDAAPATSPATITANGGHTLVAIARDAAGNERRIERTFFIGAGGTGACSLSDFDPANNAIVTTTSVTLVGRTGGAAGVKVNGTAANVANSSFSATINLPNEGPNSVTITCTDAAGTALGTPATLTLNRVTGAPSIDISNPADQSVTANETITVTGTLGGDVKEVTVNGSAATISGNTFSASNVRLAAGVNIVVARAKNSAGRTSSDSVRVNYLKNAPTIAITSPAAAFTTSAATLDISGTWTNLDPASITVSNGGNGATVQPASTSDTTGTFVAPTVSLNVGAQVITVRGVDRTGRAASATLSVTRVDGKPTISISSPADNSYFGANEQSVTVTGTFNGDNGSTVEVNGTIATVDAPSKTFSASVPFSNAVGGLTPIVARVTEPAGDAGSDSVRVTRLAAAPKVVQTFPEANAVDVNAGTLPLILFSNAMDLASVRSSVRVENAAGAPVNGDITLDRDVVTFAPAVLLTAGERYTMRVTTGAKDVAGNALAEAFAATFTVAASAPVTAPTLNAYATRACDKLTLSGAAPAGAHLRIDLGTLVFHINATSSGTFSYDLPLSGRGGFQVARVRVVGSDGSLSPAAEAQFEVDCAGPQVTDATFNRTTNVLTITFSKPIDATTIAVGGTGSVRLQLTDSTFVAGTASMATPSIVSVTPAQNLATANFTLTVTTAVKDTNGGALSSAYSRAFTIGGDEPGDGSGYISGEIFDADTGRPLPGATITIEVPVGAFARNVRSDARTSDVATSAVSAVADNRGRYVRSLPEGAHTIKASADGYTTVWRQIIVRAGVGVIPTDIRLTRRGAPANGNGSALTLKNGGEGDKPLSRAAELRIPGGVVAAGNKVTLTSLGAQSLPGLLPLGWSPLASAEIVSDATTLAASELVFNVPKDEITAASQTLTAVRYDQDRDEWRVVAAVVPVSADGKATMQIAAPGAYALVYPDKAPNLAAPPVPVSGGVLAGVPDRCASETCPPLVAKNALELTPPVVLPTQRTVAKLRIEGSGTSVFPSGTAVQAYVDEELHLADGSRDVVSPFVTDLLLYRTLAGETGEAAFHLAPSGRAAQVVLEVGYDHIRILPYPERLDRGALIGPEGGRVPADANVSVEIPSGATSEALRATATSITDYSRFGTIAGYRIVGGLSLSLQWASQTNTTDETAAVELLKPARATFSVTESVQQLILVEVLEGTPYGRIYRLAAQIAPLEGGGRYTTKAIDRAQLPVDGIVREGSYLLLAPNAPIAFATGTVRLANSAAISGARVITPPLGVVDLTRLTGIFNVPVPASAFTLVPRTVETGDGAPYNHPSATVDQIINVGALSIVSQPPTVSMTVFAHLDSGLAEIPAAGAKGVSPTSSVKAAFAPGLDPQSVGADSLIVIDDSTGEVVPGRAAAQGNTAILWTLAGGARLRTNATFTAIVSAAVRGSNGTPLGAPVSASFSTVSALTSPNVDPSKIRITMPDENGRSSIIGAPGALKEHWNAVAIRQGRDFSNHPQDDADSERKFRIELGTGTNPADRVTIDDKIYLQIINDAGSVAAIIPLGAFTSEDGRGFVARPDEETHYTTPDNISIDVPAGAFETATIVTARPADKSAIAGVPNFDQELGFLAGIKIDFNGIAKKRLNISFRAPESLSASQNAYLGYYGQSARGPRIMLIDFLRRDGDMLTTNQPATSGARPVAANGRMIAANAIVNPSPLRDMLLGIDRGAILIGFTFQTSINFVTFAPPPVPADFFIPPIESMYFASFACERGRILIPIPATRPFHIVGVDPGSGLTIIDAPYDAMQPGEPGDASPIALPTTNDFGPYPVFTSPGRTEILDLNSDAMEDESIRNLVVSFDGTNVTIKNSSDPLPANTRVEVTNLRTGVVLRRSDFAAAAAGAGLNMAGQLGDRLLFLIGDKDVDPDSSVLTVVFSEQIVVGSQEQLRQQFRLLVADPTVTPIVYQPVPGITEIKADSGGRRISIIHPGSFQRGKRYRLVLSTTIQDRDTTTALSLAQKLGSSTPGDMMLDFTIREPKGLFSGWDLKEGSARDLAMSGNVLLVSSLEGGIVAYDASNPANLYTVPGNDTATPPVAPVPPNPIAKVPPPPGADSQTWALATDEHGRVFATALSPMYGVIRSYRIEDFYCTPPPPPSPGAPSPGPCAFPQQKGNAIIAWRTGINVGMPLAAMIIGQWPEATPRKMQIVTKDSDPDLSTFPDDPTPPAPGAPATGSLGNGFNTHTLNVTVTPGFRYGKQRITVTNVTRNYRWSKDVEGSGDFEIIGKPGDQIRVVKNLSTLAVVSLFGHGVGVYDLNAVEANYRHIGDQDWERLQDTLLLDTGDGGRCGLVGGCERPARVNIGQDCPINDLVFSPDSALANVGTSVGIFALDQNRGVLQLNVDRQAIDPANPTAPNMSCSRSGSLIFQERVNMYAPYGSGRVWAGHPRLNKLRHLFKAATNRDPSVRYTSIGVYKRKTDTYLLVAGNELGLLVAKVGTTPLSRQSLVDVVWIPGGAYSVRVMQDDDLATVVDGNGRVLLVNLAAIDESSRVAAGTPCSALECEGELYPTVSASLTPIPPPASAPPGTAATPVPNDSNGVGWDDPRIVWKSATGLVTGTLAPIVDTETGFVYTGNVLTRQMKVFSAVDPKVRFIGSVGTDASRARELDRVIPLGLERPLSPTTGAPSSGSETAAFQILVSLPGGVTSSNTGISSIQMAVESERVVGVAAGQTPNFLPRAHLRQSSRSGAADSRSVMFTLHHDAPSSPDPNLRFQRGWNRMISKWIVAIADPRASADYNWGGTLNAQQKADRGCFSCERPSFVTGAAGTDWYELYTAGRVIAVRPERCSMPGPSGCASSSNTIFDPSQPYKYLGDRGRLENRIATTMADTVRPTHVLTASQSAPFAIGAHQESFLVHSGEVMNSTVDFDAGGRAGWNVVFDRTYRSRTLGLTALGAGWDSSVFQRLRLLPNNDVEYRDGSGETWRFTASGGNYTSPAGVDVKLARYREGWRMTDAKQRITDFDDLGRLVLQADEFYDLTANKGNIITYSYNADGQLSRIVDPVGRPTTLEYEGDRLTKVKDWRNREILLHVQNGLLRQVELPERRGHLGYSFTGSSGRPKQDYTYVSAGSGMTEQLELGTNLESIREPGDSEDRVTFEYETSGAKRDMVKIERWHTLDNAFAEFKYTLSSTLPVSTETIIEDALKQKRTYTLTPVTTPNYADDRVHISKLVEAQVPVWSGAAFGQLPTSISTSTFNNTDQDRTWTFGHHGAGDNRTLQGRVKSVKVGVGTSVAVETTFGWTALNPAGAVLQSRNVISSAGGLGHTFNYTSAYLDSVTSDDVTGALPSPEPRRGTLTTTAVDAGVQVQATRDEFGLPKSSTSTATGGLASGAGAQSSIDYHPANDSIKHRRGMPDILREGASGVISTDVVYDQDDPYKVTYNRVGRNYGKTEEYDEGGNLIRVSESGTDVDTEEVFAYDARGRMVAHRTKQDDTKYVEERYTYDRVGRVLSHSIYQGSTTPSQLLQQTDFEYHLPERYTLTRLPQTGPLRGDVKSVLDGLGRVQDRISDPKNPSYMGLPSVITERTRYDVDGNVVFTSDGLSATATRYDGAHRPKETLDSAGLHTLTTIDGFGRMKTYEDVATGYTVSNEYDGSKLKTTSTNTSQTDFTWDGAGRPRTSVSDPRDGATKAITTQHYDDAGRLLDTSFGEGTSTSMTRTFNSVTYGYADAPDLPGSITSKEDNDTRQYTQNPIYDALGRARQVNTLGAADMKVEQDFNSIGDAKRVKTPAMRGDMNYDYDGRGFMTSEIKPATATEPVATNAYDYTASGVLKSYTDPTGEATRTDNDGLGRPYLRTYPDLSTEEIHYDLWRVSRVKDRQNRWQRFVYEPETGRLKQVINNEGVVLDELQYDDQGRLIIWRTPESRLEFRSFDAENRPQLTIQTRLRADGTAVDEYQQSHLYDGFGRRKSWSMPGASLPQGWTTQVQPHYDAAGNLTRLDRTVSGGGSSGTLLESDYRTSGRPKFRQINAGIGTAGATEIRREYDYDPAAGRLNLFRVFAGGVLMAGSQVTYDGTKLTSATLLGIANGERVTSWDYDERGRLRASAAAGTDANAAANASARTVLPKLNNGDFLEQVTTVGGTGPAKTFGEAAGHKVLHTGDAGDPFEYKKADGSSGLGSVRTRDDHYIYEFDEKERLRKVTQRPYGTETFLLRVVYSYSGLGRMIGRRVEIADVNTGTIPSDADFHLATAMQLGPDAGLPPETTFVWDPISDQLVSVFDTQTGKPIRQFLHGGMGLDDPIEVAVAENNGVARYYPIYDEAGDGNLQAILTATGKVVARTIITDPFGDGEVALPGAAVDNVTITRVSDGVKIEVAFTEPIDSSTLASGVRLAAVTGGNDPSVVATTSATPALTGDNRVVRWSLSNAQWNELANASGAVSLSVGVTDSLRASTYSENSPIVPANTTLHSGIYATEAMPFELRDTFTMLASRLSSAGATYTAYELTTLAGTNIPTGSGTGAATIRGAAQADSAALLLLTSSFQAQSFMDPFTLKNYVRARWYDPETASWLSADPEGYTDSSNLYAFAGGDPVNGRDPSGSLCERANAAGWWDWVQRCKADVLDVAADFGKNTGHDVWNVASLGTLERVEKQKNLGTWKGVAEATFNGARSVSNTASFGLQDAIYETQMREGAGIRSIGKGVSQAAYDLLPMEEARALIQEGDQLDTAEKLRLVFTGISKTAGVLAGAKSLGQAGAARYYRSRVTTVYRRAIKDYSGRGLSDSEIGTKADAATKRWSSRHLSDYEQVFDPDTSRTYPDSAEGARPDVLLPEYGEGIEFKKTFGTAWRAQDQFGKFVDLFPEYNIEYVLGDGGWVSPTGTPIINRAYMRSVGATAFKLRPGGR